ncbi:MAG: hypothetical protein MK289_08015 [Trichodesmium sp. ALOHA_ZT_67]|nr:hypothetical protein [Trichodesmium erythraeum GBRTRLIN201]MCH2048410.1 hypothetical protein [Trichodesmium sp. ALOHA_ZT_67]MDE5094300.1 hypothetical protein [Trichodesmium sp. St11_bin5]MDT9340696.1 hypothetical protein [Trichodesmium erythraeum 21-75]
MPGYYAMAIGDAPTPTETLRCRVTVNRFGSTKLLITTHSCEVRTERS